MASATKPGVVQEAATPATMLHHAITSGANVEVMEKLLGLQERWEANQARKAFDAALADLRNDLPAVVKTKAANFGQGRAAYKYEDLSEMIEQLSEPLSRHGLSFRWRTESTASDSVTVTCILSHRDGHSESTSLAAKHDLSGNKNGIQAIGSAVTYLQRYTLKAALGVAASMDDDAQAVGTPRPEYTAPAKPFAGPQRVTDGQRKQLWNTCKAKGISEQQLKERLELYGWDSTFAITTDKFPELLKWANSGGGIDPLAQEAPPIEFEDDHGGR